jgi:hypothetical protein
MLLATSLHVKDAHDLPVLRHKKGVFPNLAACAKNIAGRLVAAA